MKNEWSSEELMRLMNGLEDLGLNSQEILDFICWIGTGDEKYKPISRKKQALLFFYFRISNKPPNRVIMRG